jgi:hypothetical protein
MQIEFNQLPFRQSSSQLNGSTGIKPATIFFLENQLLKNELHAKSCQLPGKN